MEAVVRKKQHRFRVKQELSSAGHPVSLCWYWSSCWENQKLSDGLDLTGGLLIGQDFGISSSKMLVGVVVFGGGGNWHILDSAGRWMLRLG